MTAGIPQDFIDELSARLDIVDVVGSCVELKKQSKDEYLGLCPFHNEKTPSFTVTQGKGLYHCFGCGAGGNSFDFVMANNGLKFPDAIRKLAADKGMEVPDPKKPKARKPKAKLVKAYDYIDENGELRYQVCRMDPKSFRQRRPDGAGWKWSVKDVEPLPYNLPDLLANPDATLLIVEGEKDVESLKAIAILATCNSGGAGKWPTEICGYFEDRNVVIVEDNDAAGEKHSKLVCSELFVLAKSIRVLKLPDLADKGDVTDWIQAGGDRPALIELCKNTDEWGPEALADPQQQEMIPEADYDDQEDPPETPESSDTAPFKCLGYDEGTYFYLPHRTQQVVSITTGSHTSVAQLLALAPLEFWEFAFPAKMGADWFLAANACMRWSENAGTFDSAAIRGRGAWFDAGRSVLHLGNQLLVDNTLVPLHDLDTKFIYEKKPALEALEIGEPLTSAQALGLYHVTKSMNWSKPINAALLAGWCVLAPICGAIPWRPHIWITGRKGTGKTWLTETVIAPVIGGAALMVQSTSTEAGIRQKLRQDARPVMFDEAEGESLTARSRMQHVLELARQASSDGLAEIAKGTAGGKAQTYRVRSMFMMGSINVGLNHASDKSRFTVLSLVMARPGKPGRKQFEELEALVDKTITPEWCASLRARTYKLIPIIRKNAKVLAKAAAEHIGNQRSGDQLGALLAGCYSLKSDELITLKQAEEWVRSHDWGLDQDEKADSDEHQLCAEILHAIIKVDTMKGMKSRSISELVSIAAADITDDEITKIDADKTLARHGIRVQKDRLVVSESHPELRKILSETQWVQGWARILERIKGAEKISGCRFAGIIHRAISIPLGEVNGQNAELKPEDDEKPF